MAPTPSLSPCTACLGVLLLSACGDEDVDDTGASALDDTGGPAGLEAHDPSASGPHPVGTEEVEITGSTGVSLTVQLWYPAVEGSDGDLHAYDGFAMGTALDGPEPRCDRARPVLLFSHGNSGIRFQSIFLTEHLASQGWVVVAPDHTGNTLFDYDSEALADVMIRRPQDISDAFDWALGAESPVADCLDPEGGFAVAGHSFGGFTSLAVAGAHLDVAASAAECEAGGYWLCEELAAWAEANPGEEVAALSDARAWAAVPMAPAGFEVLTGGLPDIGVPSLVWGGSRDALTTMEQQVGPIYGALTVSPRYLAELRGAGHYTFSNACDWVNSYDDCSPPYLAPEEAHPIIRTVTTAFLDQARGVPDREPWLPTDDERLVWTAE